MLKKITLILFLITSIFISIIDVQATTNKNLVNIYFFHSNTCSHCQEETKFLNKLEEQYSNIKIYKYEIHEEDNKKLLEAAEKIYNIKINSVPVTIIGNKIYTGFSDKSQITFIKTIEYFSKYGYIDELGKYLKIELPNYEVSDNNIELDEFIETYHNYNLLGLKTDKLDPSNTAIILGLLSSFNLITIISIILVALITTKINKSQNKIFIIIIYLIANTILLLSNLINNYIFNIIVYLLLLIPIIYSILKIIKKNKNYIYLIITMLISFISSLLVNILNNKNISVFQNILNLHNLTGLNKISYYANYIILNITITIIIIYIGYITINKIKSILTK